MELYGQGRIVDRWQAWADDGCLPHGRDAAAPNSVLQTPFPYCLLLAHGSWTRVSIDERMRCQRTAQLHVLWQTLPAKSAHAAQAVAAQGGQVSDRHASSDLVFDPAMVQGLANHIRGYTTGRLSLVSAAGARSQPRALVALKPSAPV